MDDPSTFTKDDAGQTGQTRFSRAPKRSRRRSAGAKPWLLLFLALALCGAIYVGLYPWAFFMGGNFHPLGYWSGWGRIHSKTAGDYLLYVTLSPVTYGHETFPAWDVKGTGDICTPKGERFRLRVRGSMPRKFYINSAGQPISLSIENWRKLLPVAAERRPSFSLSGRWGQRQIIADDRGTVSHAFLPDGTLRPRKSRVSSSETEDIQFTLQEGSYSEWKAACPNVR